MDNERLLKNEFRRALDEVLPPVPWLEAAVADDLHKRRAGGSVDRTPGVQRRSDWSSRPAIQLAASVLIVVLAAATVVTFLVMRNSGPQSAPAGAFSIEAYQSMMRRDDGLLNITRSNDCSSLDVTCPAPGSPVMGALQRWLDDLNRAEPPARFAVIDVQLRRHLAANISDLHAEFAAYQAHDEDGLLLAYEVAATEGYWIDVVASSIASSQPGTAAAYLASVRLAYQDFAGCAACQSLIDQVNCSGMQTTSCAYDLIYAAGEIERFQLAPVRVAAPSSLAAQDSRLQTDLAQVDNAVLAMSTAQATGDQTAFTAGRLMLQQTLPALKRDSAGIVVA